MPPKETLRKFNIKNSATLVDIGCGTGYFTTAAAEILKEGTVIGLDIMNEMLEAARKKSIGIKNIEYRKCEEYSFPIEDQSVEYVFVSNVLHEVENKIKYLEEIKRITKQDGFLCIIEWDKRSMEKGPKVEERISIEEIKELCNHVSMEFVEKISINNDHYGVKFKNISIN